ncbi:cupin domain-containing protein [Pleomorphovibrio marinus]|uniref:cupin domain-containing protein n=1 Tax=Pleomorphovibrio marinus TaxID=2164132 RepID=UPI000E0BEEE1|nr:cupin domain-containing protein [Pleomorphovibrio marinus]
MSHFNCLLLISLLFALKSSAQQLPLPSGAYEFSMLPVVKNDAGEKRHLFNWPTKTLDNFQVDIYTLFQDKERTEESSDFGKEKLVLVIKGTLEISHANEKQQLTERSIALISKEQQAHYKNTGADNAIFYVIQWDSGNLNDAAYENSWTFIYDEMEFKSNVKGGRRDVMEAPTKTLSELEMHITTLLEGEKSHDPHVHPDEEIIVVLQGEVEEMINGTPYRLGPGSMIFLSAMDPHGIRNIGKGTCEYYAIRWTTDKDG